MTRGKKTPPLTIETVADALLGNDEEAGALGLIDDLSMRRSVDEVLFLAGLSAQPPIVDECPRHSDRAMDKRRTPNTLLAVVAGITFTVFGAVIWRLFSASPDASAPPAAGIALVDEMPRMMATVSRTEGGLFQGERALFVGDPVSPGEPIVAEFGYGTVSWPTGIEVFLNTSASVMMRQDADTRDYVVELYSGRYLVSVDPNRQTPPVQFITQEGTIAVKGTVFGVEVSSTATRVDLLRGRLEITAIDGRTRSLHAGQMMANLDAPPHPIPLPHKERLWQEIRDANFLADDPGIPPADSSTIASNDELDKSVRGSTGAAEEVKRPCTPRRKSEARLPSATDLLKTARRQRLAREWSAVRITYQTLIDTYPTSESAKVALVALAEMELSRFANSKKALILFRRYLESGHRQLRQEAMWGKAEALGKLGKKADEQIALEQYTASFPSAPKRAAAKARLDFLKNASPI